MGSRVINPERQRHTDEQVTASMSKPKRATGAGSGADTLSVEQLLQLYRWIAIAACR